MDQLCNNHSSEYVPQHLPKVSYDDIVGTAMFTGNARLPTGIALYEMMKVISCVLIVDMNTSTVVDASFTTISPTANNYLRSVVMGWKMNEGFQMVEERLNKHCQMTSKKSFIKCIEVAYQRYCDYITESKLKMSMNL